MISSIVNIWDAQWELRMAYQAARSSWNLPDLPDWEGNIHHVFKPCGEKNFGRLCHSCPCVGTSRIPIPTGDKGKNRLAGQQKDRYHPEWIPVQDLFSADLNTHRLKQWCTDAQGPSHYSRHFGRRTTPFQTGEIHYDQSIDGGIVYPHLPCLAYTESVWGRNRAELTSIFPQFHAASEKHE